MVMDSPNSQRLFNEHNKLKEELNNLKKQKENNEENEEKNSDFLTEDQKFNELITREYLNTNFQKIVSIHTFNDFAKENKLILNRIYKQFSCINDNIAKIDISINKCMEKSVNDLVDFNKNISFNVKKQTEIFKSIIISENSIKLKHILFYFMDLVFKLFLFYIFHKYILLDSYTCNL